MFKFPPILEQLESYRASRLAAVLNPINIRLARRMGLTMAELKAHVAAGDLQTIKVGRAMRMVDEGEARRFTEVRGRQLIPLVERTSFGARHGG